MARENSCNEAFVQMAEAPAAAPGRGGFSRGFGDGGRGGREGGRGRRDGGRGRGRGRGKREDEDQWIPCTKLGRLVQQGKIKSMEQMYLFSLPIKEHQIVDQFLGSTLKVRNVFQCAVAALRYVVRLGVWLVFSLGGGGHHVHVLSDLLILSESDIQVAVFIVSVLIELSRPCVRHAMYFDSRATQELLGQRRRQHSSPIATEQHLSSGGNAHLQTCHNNNAEWLVCFSHKQLSAPLECLCVLSYPVPCSLST